MTGNREGLVPVKKTITRNGKQIEQTYWERPDIGVGGPAAAGKDLKQRPANLGLEDQDTFTPEKFMTNFGPLYTPMSEAPPFTDMRECFPETAFDNKPAVRQAVEDLDSVDSMERLEPEQLSNIATVYSASGARVEAHERVLADLEDKFRYSFSDKEVFSSPDAEDGKIRYLEDGRYAFVQQERARFHPDNAGLTEKQIAECSEPGIVPGRIRSEFPDTWEDITEPTGDVYVTNDNDMEPVADAWHKDLSKNPGYSAGPSKFNRTKEGKKQLFEAYLNAESDLNAARKFHDDFRGKLNERWSTTAHENLKLKEMTPTGANEAVARMSRNMHVDRKTGASLSVRPRFRTDTAKFLEAREQRHLAESYVRDSEGRIEDSAHERRASIAAARDFTKIATAKVRAEKVKELYPEKYERGKPTERRVYIGGEPDAD